MEYWGLDAADAVPPSPAAAAIKAGNFFLKKNWGVLVFGGATVVFLLTVQAVQYRMRARERQLEETERRERENVDQRASSGDAEAIQLVRQRNQRDAVAAQARRDAQNAYLENLIQDQSCSCM